MLKPEFACSDLQVARLSLGARVSSQQHISITFTKMWGQAIILVQIPTCQYTPKRAFFLPKSGCPHGSVCAAAQSSPGRGEDQAMLVLGFDVPRWKEL